VSARARFGEFLVETGTITPQQLGRALGMQEQTHEPLGQTLLQLGLLNEDSLFAELARHSGLETVDLLGVAVPAEVQRRLPFHVVQAGPMIPLGFDGRVLDVGVADPRLANTIPELEFTLGQALRPNLVSRPHLEAALRFFEVHGYGRHPLILETGDLLRPDSFGRRLDGFLSMLVSKQGQDLHLSAGAVPAIRIDDQLRRLPTAALPPQELEALVLEVMDEDQREKFKFELELDFGYSVEGVGRFRCNAYRQRGSVSFNARHIADRIPSAESLRLPPFVLDHALRTHGLLLITGPNGHGKSTTLACLIDHINRSRRANIVTIEDPIEFHHRHQLSNVNQREVGRDTRSFDEGLRRVVRQDPDVIVIGELRDPDTIATALTAAQTGHLVMGTMHTLDAIETVDRILDAFPGPRQALVRCQLAESLLLVLAQRLVRRAEGTGRLLAWEKMANCTAVKTAIREGRTHVLRSMMQANIEAIRPIERSLADFVAAGLVEREEAARWANDRLYLDFLLQPSRPPSGPALRKPGARAPTRPKLARPRLDAGVGNFGTHHAVTTPGVDAPTPPWDDDPAGEHPRPRGDDPGSH